MLASTRACNPKTVSSSLPLADFFASTFLLFFFTLAAPSGQLELILFDISSVSVQVEFNTSSIDDGGARLSAIRLLYSLDAGTTWLNVEVSSTGPALLPSLQPGTQYQLRAQTRNEIGK